MEKQPFIEFVASIISDEYFINQNEEYKKGVYTKLQQIYDETLESKFQSGLHSGYTEGIRHARELIYKK
jgi:hypothetical protein